jgi:hypothetical protein
VILRKVADDKRRHQAIGFEATSELKSPQEDLPSISQAVAVLKIPMGNRETAILQLSRAVMDIVNRKRRGSMKSDTKSTQAIAKLTEQLLAKLGSLSPVTRSFLIGRGVECSGDDLYRKFLAEIESLHQNACRASRHRKRKANRPLNSFKATAVRSLVHAIVGVVSNYGGTLTLGFNVASRRLNGTVPAVLNLLHDAFPDVVPSDTPFQTLNRMRNDAISRYTME